MFTTEGLLSITLDISLSFIPTTVIVLISSIWWSVSMPLRAAEESLTRPTTFPSLK